MTRVLFLDQSGQLGGGALSLLDIATAWKDRCEVGLFADGPFAAALAERGVPVGVLGLPDGIDVRRDMGPLAALRAVPAALGLIGGVARLSRGFDLVYANSQKSMVIGAIAARLSRRPLIWHLRDILDRSHFGPTALTLVVVLANRLATRVIANSRATAAAFVAAGGDPAKLSVVWNGIDAGPFDAVEAAEVERLRTEIGAGNAPLVGVFSRLAPWKGQHVLVEALAALPGVHGVLAGEALFGETAYAESLRRRAEDGGVAGRLAMLGFRRDIPQLMRAVDVVVHTSTAPEPFGRVLVEGMLAGRPVVATRGGGPEEIIEDGVTGVLVPPEDPAALAQAIRRLLADRPWRETLVARARKRAVEVFSLAAMQQGVAAEIAAVMGSGFRGEPAAPSGRL